MTPPFLALGAALAAALASLAIFLATLRIAARFVDDPGPRDAPDEPGAPCSDGPDASIGPGAHGSLGPGAPGSGEPPTDDPVLTGRLNSLTRQVSRLVSAQVACHREVMGTCGVLHQKLDCVQAVVSDLAVALAAAPDALWAAEEPAALIPPD